MACLPTETQTDFGCLSNDPNGFIGQFYGIGLGIIGGVAILFIIFGGFTIITSQGDPRGVNRGKSYIYYALAGLLLAVFGYAFMKLIVVDFLHIPGFN